MSPISVLYVTAGLVGTAAGSRMRGPGGPAWVARAQDAGALLVTGFAGIATAAVGASGGPIASLGWFCLGWTLGVLAESRCSG